jgi:hypothetical protein
MGVTQRKLHSVRLERFRQAASVRGPSNKELKRHLAVGSEVTVWVSVAARCRLTPNALAAENEPRYPIATMSNVRTLEKAVENLIPFL